MSGAKLRSLMACLAADTVAIVIFAVVGVFAHHGAFDPLVFLRVAAPFWAAYLFGFTCVLIGSRDPLRVRPGVVIWAITTPFGIVLRELFGASSAVAFMIVTAVTLAVLLIGWRIVVNAIKPRVSASTLAFQRRSRRVLER